MFARELHDNLNDPMNVFSWVVMGVMPSFFSATEVTDFFTDFLAPIHYLDAFAQNTGPGQGAYCTVGCSRVSIFKRSWSNLQPYGRPVEKRVHVTRPGLDRAGQHLNC